MQRLVDAGELTEEEAEQSERQHSSSRHWAPTRA